LSPKAYQ